MLTEENLDIKIKKFVHFFKNVGMIGGIALFLTLDSQRAKPCLYLRIMQFRPGIQVSTYALAHSDLLLLALEKRECQTY